MSVSWMPAAAAALVAFALVVYAHVQAESRAWPAWTLALSGARQALVRWLRTNTNAHLGALQGTLGVARADERAGRPADTVDVIVSADALVSRHVMLLRAWLRRWADVARALRALAPTPRLPPGPVHLTVLRQLAVVQRLGVVLLPTRGLRFQARVGLLRTALQWLGWNFTAASLRARRPGQLAPALDHLDCACADLVALDSQAIATLEHLLLSLPPDTPGA